MNLNEIFMEKHDKGYAEDVCIGAEREARECKEQGNQQDRGMWQMSWSKNASHLDLQLYMLK